MILKDGRRDTQEARELLPAVEQLRLVANQSQAGWSRCKRAMIDSFEGGRARNDRTCAT